MVNDHHLRIGKQKLDPLTDTAPEAGRVLFERFNMACREFPLDAVVNAAGNVLLNVIRQRNATRPAAELDFDDMFGQLKAILMAHYDGASGNRRNVFPFHQVIYPPFVKRTPPKE